MNRKKIFWAIASLLIAGLSIWAVIAQNKNFSAKDFFDFIAASNPLWLILALVCMFGFIWFEGFALVRIVTALGYKKGAGAGTVYGAADVYFSAITPSASGGQPASAFFMMRDGIPGTIVTVSLLINLVMYTLALLFLGVISMIFRGDIFIHLSILSRILVIVGIGILILLALLFYLLLKKPGILYSVCNGFLKFLGKIHLLKNGQKIIDKLNRTVDDYKEAADTVTGHWRMLLEVFIWNVFQRLSQLFVSFMVFMATGEGIKKALDVTFVQCFVAMGSNCIPIPGAMGVADYLMLDGFTNVVGADAATNMELLCRSISFYGCIITSAVIVVIGYIIPKIKNRRKNNG